MPQPQMPMLENQSPAWALDFALSRRDSQWRLQMLGEHLEQWVRCGYTGWITQLKTPELFHAGLDGVIELQDALGRLPEKLGREMAHCFLRYLLNHPERMDACMLERLRLAFYPVEGDVLQQKRDMAGVLVDCLRYDPKRALLPCDPQSLPAPAARQWLGFAVFTWCLIQDRGSPGGQGIKLDRMNELVDGLLACKSASIDPPWAPDNWVQRLANAPGSCGAGFGSRLLQGQTPAASAQTLPRRV